MKMLRRDHISGPRATGKHQQDLVKLHFITRYKCFHVKIIISLDRNVSHVSEIWTSKLKFFNFCPNVLCTTALVLFFHSQNETGFV